MANARKLFQLMFVVLLLVSSALAQEFTGNINGRVADSTGAVIPGVQITLTSPAIQGTREGLSGEAGVYQFRLLPAGSYTLKFELTGFKTIIRQDVLVEVGKTVAINIAMDVAT